MPSFVVGVDGGGTKTIALVADDQGRILGSSRGGGSNWNGVDVETSIGVVIFTVQQALARANLTGSDISLGLFGLAGADWPEDYEQRAAILSQSGVAQQVIVKNDTLVGWRANACRPYGVVIAAGTATNTAVVTPDGREWHYGYYAQYGGAKDISLEAIRAVLRAEDGRGKPTTLTDLVLNKLGYPTVEALFKAWLSKQLQRKQIYSLCPLVFETAHTGDEVAAEIIVKQGLALAEYATAAIRRFGMQSLKFDVVLSGSVFKGQGPLLMDTVTQAIHRVAPRARLVPAKFEPAAGAVLLAYDALGIALTDEIYNNLAQTLPGPEFFNTVNRR